ncbi:ZIP family metal transporter [Synechococcus sp. PCC 7336]|uniref:ZIP family metal transporter n=1 Tax=Synechococcus sp. PCC 7336 TaxID=195250 RepID=UPI00034DEC44|nr:hypothetical protein [Synechococcus sp. PCC 7336]
MNSEPLRENIWTKFDWRRILLGLVLPLLLLAAVVGLFGITDPLGPLNVSAPPIEELAIETAILHDDGISLNVRAAGSEPMQIAQVQVDGAYWEFQQDPAGPISRLSKVNVEIPYPWVQDETHHILLVTASGVTFDYEIEVAVPTPSISLNQLANYALLGIYVGIVPVGLGMLFYPYLRTLGARGMQFILALTVGLLSFLLLDTLAEGLELATEAASVFQGSALVWLSAGVTFLGLIALGRRRGQPPTGMPMATYLAFSIGLHNFGEGLAIGAAFASGEAALGSLLVIGFTLHNVSEGIGIVAPLAQLQTRLGSFLGLTALAGGPAILGTWIGVFAFSPHWAALFFGIGAGAILQVMLEVGAYLGRSARKSNNAWLSGASLAGFTMGLAVMYGTALLVSV